MPSFKRKFVGIYHNSFFFVIKNFFILSFFKRKKNLLKINEKVKSNISTEIETSIFPKIIAVSKTFSEQDILPLIEFGHVEFGENKVQEAVEKWTEIKKKNLQIFNQLKF